MARRNGRVEDRNGSGPTGVVERYDPQDFILPGQDHNGNSERIFCRVQPSIERELDVIVQSRNWPFKTKGDVIRWCVHQGIKMLERMEPMPNTFMPVAESIQAAARDQEYWHAFQTSLDQLEKTIGLHMNSGSEEEAMKLLSECKTSALKIQEDIWREKFMKEFERRFGHVFERMKGKRIKLGVGQKEVIE